MGAPSVVVPEVVVNIGGSIASLNVASSSPAWWKARTNLAAPVVD